MTLNALEGVTFMLLAGRDGPDSVSQHRRVLAQVRQAGVRHVVKLAAIGASSESPIALMREHHEVDEEVRKGLEPEIDTGGPMGRMVLTVLGMVAEMELGFIRDRQRAGIDAARVRGVLQRSPGHIRPPASSHCARKGWEPQKSQGLSGASGATSIRRSRLRGSTRLIGTSCRSARAAGFVESQPGRSRAKVLRQAS
jgi:hypothetical protein